MKSLVKYFGLTLLSVCLGFSSNAQSYVDAALLFGRTNAGGTARIQGLAGTQVSLGGDPRVAIGNPAGLGMANRSSFTVSGGFFNNQNITDYYGNSTPGSKFNLQVPQLGIIFHAKGNDSDFKGGSFAVNYSRIDNYHTEINYSGFPDNSIIDYFLDRADGMDPVEFEAGGLEYNSLLGLAWWTYLFDLFYDEQNNEYFYGTYSSYFPDEQGEEVSVKGRHNQWNFSYGGNYKDKVFFGLGIGITNLSYNNYRYFNEYYDDPNSELTSLFVEEDYQISGTGINTTLGLIARPVDFIQVGLTYTSPTKYNLNDLWVGDIEANWDNIEIAPGEFLGTEVAESDLLAVDYSLVLPDKVAVGVTGFLGKYGFVTADIEKVNYSRMRFNSRDFSMSPENSEVLDRFTSVVNVRFGAEFRYDIFRFRGGIATYGNPYVQELEFDPVQDVYTLGMGIRKKNKFADIAFIRSTEESGFFPYTVQGQGEVAHTWNYNTSVMLTLGWNF